jgi:hypothetical protein
MTPQMAVIPRSGATKQSRCEARWRESSVWFRPLAQASVRIRTRPSSITEKYPAQSSRAARPAKRSPASFGFGIGIRNSTAPHVAGRVDARASSPKSLIKGEQNPRGPRGPCQYFGVTRARCRGPDPNNIVAGRFEHCDGRAGEVLVGKKTHSGCTREYLLRAQRVSGVGKTGEYVFVSYARIVG